MNNLSLWVHNYKSLSFEQQYEVAKAIVESLENNKYQSMLSDEDVTKVISFFKKAIVSFEQKKLMGRKGSVLKRFESLSQTNKEKVLSSIINAIETKVQEQRQEADTCQCKGHIFGEWEKREYVKSFIDDVQKHTYYDRSGYLQNDTAYVFRDYKVTEWIRECKRCGLVETVDQEPQELTNAGKEEKGNARIKNW